MITAQLGLTIAILKFLSPKQLFTNVKMGEFMLIYGFI